MKFDDESATVRSVDAAIGRIRRKIGQYASLLVTRPDSGYCCVEDQE